MGFFKILGGACAGVATVVALPIAGPIGAVTAIGAAVAATVGAAAGAAWEHFDDTESEAEQRGYRRGSEEKKAEYAQKMEKLQKQLQEMMVDIAKREQFILTAFAVGMCCANVDGEICSSEMEDLDYFVCGVGTSDILSETTKKQIEIFRKDPPNFNTVLALIKKHNFYDKKHMNIFGEIVCIVAQADGNESKEEKEFIDAWNTLAEDAA